MVELGFTWQIDDLELFETPLEVLMSKDAIHELCNQVADSQTKMDTSFPLFTKDESKGITFIYELMIVLAFIIALLVVFEMRT